MENGPSSGALSDVSGSTVSSTSSSPEIVSDEDQLIEAIENAIYELNLASKDEKSKYFAGFVEMAALVRNRPDLINDSKLFYLVFKYIKVYFEDTNDRACTDHLVAVLKSGNQFDGKYLELVFLWAMRHELSEVLEALLSQNICFIRSFRPVCFKIFISLQKLPKFLEYLLFSSWPSQTSDLELMAIFKELFEYAARKGTPEMLNVFLNRCEQLNCADSVVNALDKAISENNIPNVVFLWKNKHVDTLNRHKITSQIMQSQNTELFNALMQEDSKSTFCEKLIFRVSQMYALGAIDVDDAQIVLGLVEAQIAVMRSLHDLPSEIKRKYYLDIAQETLGVCKTLSRKSTQERDREKLLMLQVEKILEASEESTSMKRQDSLVDEILSPRKAPLKPHLLEQEISPDLLNESYTPLRSASKLRLHKEASEEVLEQLEKMAISDRSSKERKSGAGIL